MGNDTTTAQIDRFLHDLERALADRPETERAEIVGGVREHIDAALRGRNASADEVETVLRSLGDPLEIAAAAETERGHPMPGSAAPSSPRPRLTAWWVPSIVLPLTAFCGFGLFLVIPVVPLLIGLTIFWNSSLWKPLEKVVGTVAMTVPSALLIIGSLVAFGAPEVCSQSGMVGDPSSVTETCTGGIPDWLGTLNLAGMLTVLGAGVVVMIVLIARGTRRSNELDR